MAFPERPALRGFVDGRWALAFTFLYPVLFSNGPILAVFPQKGRTFAFHFFGVSVPGSLWKNAHGAFCCDWRRTSSVLNTFTRNHHLP